MPVWLTRNWWRERARDGGALISVCLGFASGLLYAVIELAAAGILTAASLGSDACDVARWLIENPPYWLTRAWWKTWIAAPILEDHPDVRTAEQWFLDYQPQDRGDAYTSVREYAEVRYEQLITLSEAIERKADDLMRTASTIGAALVAALKLIGVTSSPSAGLTARGTLLALFVLCQVLAVVVSASTKSSAVRVTPLSVEGLLRIADREGAEHPEGDVKAIAAASIHATIVGESILVSWRARQLRRATVLFCAGLVLLSPLALLI